ncbi:hypothetical protein [Streptomyces canus]|uniref:hypothetical protein n=1 Tax=Streptomyces canus TaxID=58343 RepID=UPI0032548875
MSAATPTPNWHYAAMRRAEDAARGLSVQHSVRMFAGGSTVDEIADLRARRDSYYRLAAAHRNAARRLERREQLRVRIERIVRPVVRIALHVRRAVTA